MLSKIPNLLSIVRIFLIPFIIYGFIIEYYFLSLIFSILACLTDLIDGFIARKFNFETQTGFYLDAFADKMFILSLYLAMGIKFLLPLYLVIIVIFKDMFIFGFYVLFLLINTQLSLKVSKLSKINTTFQMILIILVLLIEVDIIKETNLFNTLIEAFIFIVGITTISSLIFYIFRWFHEYN